MTLVPLAEARCGLPKTRKKACPPINVPGTANISFGYKLREREPEYVAKYHGSRRSIFESAEERLDKREYEQFLKTLEFEKETNRKIRNKNLRQRLQQDMWAYEEGLQTRRERLRDLILREEASLTREIVEEVRRGEDARLEEMRARLKELRKQQDEEHEAVVAAKRMQQYLASCPDVKRELSRRSAIDAKRCNVAQMADNEAKRSAERKLDALWHELMLRELEAKKRQETEESTERVLAQQEQASTLVKQVANRKLVLEEEKKQARKDERERLEQLWEEVRCAELRNLETERQKREKLKRELEEQILATKKFLVEQAREEAEVDRMLAEEELTREKTRVKESSAILRAELLAYLKYLEDLRQEEVRRNLEVEAIVQQSNKDIEAKRELALRKFKEARRRALQEVLCGREEQLKKRREAEEAERLLKTREKETLEKQIEVDANLTAMERRESRQKALRYGLELKEQREHIGMMRRRKSEEERRFQQAEMKRQADEYQRLTDELLNASENITPHPFKVLLKECAARHAAEREGRCYCPPALTSA